MWRGLLGGREQLDRHEGDSSTRVFFFRVFLAVYLSGLLTHQAHSTSMFKHLCVGVGQFWVSSSWKTPLLEGMPCAAGGTVVHEKRAAWVLLRASMFMLMDSMLEPLCLYQ